MVFIIYRGTGGLLASLSPWAVGIVLRYPLQYIFHFDHHLILGDGLWSNGLAMFLGGLLTACILHRRTFIDGATEATAGTPVHEYAPAATGSAVLGTTAARQEESQSPTLEDTESKEEQPFANDDEAVKGISSNNSSVQPLETDASDNDHINTTSTMSMTSLGTIILWLRQRPPHPHHLFFVSTDRIALVWMILGILFIILDLINFILSPLGGIMNVLLWTFVISIVTCMFYMICGPVPSAHYEAQEESSEEAEAPGANEGDNAPAGEATHVGVGVPVPANTGITSANDDALHRPSVNDENEYSSTGGDDPKEIV